MKLILSHPGLRPFRAEPVRPNPFISFPYDIQYTSGAGQSIDSQFLIAIHMKVWLVRPIVLNLLLSSLESFFDYV